MAKRKPNKNRARNTDRSGSPGGGSWLYGTHAVLAALANPNRVCHRLLIAEADPEHTHAAAEASAQSGVPRPSSEPIDRRGLNDLMPAGSVNQGIAVQVAPLEEVVLDEIAKAKGDQLVVVLDQATDPRNIGAVMRSAAAFGASAVVVQDRHAPDVTAVMAKAASGALETVPLIREVNLARALKLLQDNGFWCVGFAGESQTLVQDAPLTGRAAIVLGAEGEGLRRLTRETCDVLAKIPITSQVESLNLSNAAAIALYEAARQRK